MDQLSTVLSNMVYKYAGGIPLLLLHCLVQCGTKVSIRLMKSDVHVFYFVRLVPSSLLKLKYGNECTPPLKQILLNLFTLDGIFFLMDSPL